MSKDTKQTRSGQHTISSSTLPLPPPAAVKNDHAALESYHTANGLFPIQFSQSTTYAEPHTFKSESLLFINDEVKLPKQTEEMDLKPNHASGSKSEKISHQLDSFEYIPLATKQKAEGTWSPFEIPELTAQSLISSEQVDLDNESNATLPLTSIRHYLNQRVFHQQSQGSDDMHSYEGNKKLFHHKEEYAQSKGSDISQSDDFPAICKPCFNLIEKCKLLENQNAELIKQTQALKQEVVKCQEKSRQDLQRQKEEYEPKPLNSMSASSIKDYFLVQIQQFHKILSKVNGLVQSYSIDFRGKECQFLQKCSREFKKIDQNILGREAKNQRKLEIQQIHSNYKKMITMMVKNWQLKEQKRQSDFKRALTTIIKKQESNAQSRAFQSKSQKSRKKSKCFTEKQDYNEFEEQIRINQLNRMKIQELQFNYSRQRSNFAALQHKYSLLESKLQEVQQKHRIQIGQLANQFISQQKSQANKYNADLSAFMLKMNHHHPTNIFQLEFFKALSQRIFEISNCIPFEENDEQNLFAPQSEEQMFDMVERIRRFYMQIQEYNLKRDSLFDAEKSSFILFLKELVEANKVSSDYILKEMLQNKKYDRLKYLKELIQTSRRNLKTTVPDVLFTQNSRVLRIQRAKSFTFHSLTSELE